MSIKKIQDGVLKLALHHLSAHLSYMSLCFKVHFEKLKDHSWVHWSDMEVCSNYKVTRMILL